MKCVSEAWREEATRCTPHFPPNGRNISDIFFKKVFSIMCSFYISLFKVSLVIKLLFFNKLRKRCPYKIYYRPALNKCMNRLSWLYRVTWC